MARNEHVYGEIQGLVDAFVGQLSTLVRRSALEQVQAALQSAVGGAPARGRKAGRRGPKPARAAKRGAGGGKRSPEQVGAVSEKLLAFVKKNPGLRGEQISKALKTTTGAIRLPMQKLIAKKKIKTKGQRRGTTYHAA
jgi:hypothetical protein